MMNTSKQQQGSALFVALMFLVVITLLSITAMRSSTLELSMASNEQSYRIGADSVQSAVDRVIGLNERANTTACYLFGSHAQDDVATIRDQHNCVNIQELLQSPGINVRNLVVTIPQGNAPCPVGTATSLSLRHHDMDASGPGTSGGGSCFFWNLLSDYDAREQRGGRVTTEQGTFRLQPM